MFQFFNRAIEKRKTGLSAAQLRTFADMLPVMAWTAKADGFIDWYNARWYEYTGTIFEQMKGWGWQSVHDPKELPKVLAKWKECIRTGTAFEMIFPLRGSNGRFRWFLTRVVPMRDRSGQIVRWFGSNTDVEHEHRTLLQSESLNQYIAMVERQNAFQSGAEWPTKLP